MHVTEHLGDCFTLGLFLETALNSDLHGLRKYEILALHSTLWPDPVTSMIRTVVETTMIWDLQENGSAYRGLAVVRYTELNIKQQERSGP